MKRILVVALIAIAATGTSARQTALGSRIAAPVEVTSRYSPDEAVRGAHEFADCLVHRREQAAVNVLSATTAAQAQPPIRFSSAMPAA